MKTDRRFVITEYEEPVRIRWAEESKNLVTAKEGGYDLSPAGEGKTHLTIHNILEGHGFGKLLEGLALRSARKDADAFAGRIKEAIESS